MAAGNKGVPSIKSIRISRSKLDLIQMIFRNLATILLIAVVVQELRKPKESRQWHGKVAWFVPYDFRTPTLGRVKTTIWAPENPRHHCAECLWRRLDSEHRTLGLPFADWIVTRFQPGRHGVILKSPRRACVACRRQLFRRYPLPPPALDPRGRTSAHPMVIRN